MLLRNVFATRGLCNGTTLEVLELPDDSIETSIFSGSLKHKRVLIPRIKANPNDGIIPFVLHRTRFTGRFSYDNDN